MKPVPIHESEAVATVKYRYDCECGAVGRRWGGRGRARLAAWIHGARCDRDHEVAAVVQGVTYHR